MTFLKDRAKEIADIIRDKNSIHIVTHIDADGITAGSIAYKTLQRQKKKVTIEFIKQLDNKILERLTNEKHELVWFTDLGSSVSNDYEEMNKIITDHHICPENSDHSYHLNPHLFNIDGGIELSGAGATYVVSKTLDKKNGDLAGLAIIGACGDLQDRRHGRLTGYNREILKDAESNNTIKTLIDIRFFGRETRPIHKLLQYANDPIIPGLTGRESSCISFLKENNIIMKDGDNWRRWIDLSKPERKKIISEIMKILLKKGFGYKNTVKTIGEVYLLENETIGTELHEAKEYATLLNSTARYGKHDVGLQVCLGDRDKFLKQALNLLRGHRANIVEGIQFAKEEGIIRLEYLQYFHAKNGIRDTIVGIIANMLLNSEEISSDLPLIGFAYKNQQEVKVSARGTDQLVEIGLNLSSAMKKTAASLKGVGGGHNIAAGATIPIGKEEEFLEKLEKEIKNQLES